MSTRDIRAVRATLGAFWEVERPITPHELASVLRLRGDDALRTVNAWEMGTRNPSGPVTLALDLMTPPEAELRAEIAAWVGAITMPEGSPRPGLSLRGFLRTMSAYEPEAIDRLLGEIVDRVAEALLVPDDIDEILGAEPSPKAVSRTGMYRAAVRAQERARRPVPEVVRIPPKKKFRTPLDPH